ncbi:MAG TPA: hypothetical protein VGI88_12210 [Verrucomicrobiae bacterium]
MSKVDRRVIYGCIAQQSKYKEYDYADWQILWNALRPLVWLRVFS